MISKSQWFGVDTLLKKHRIVLPTLSVVASLFAWKYPQMVSIKRIFSFPLHADTASTQINNTFRTRPGSAIKEELSISTYHFGAFCVQQSHKVEQWRWVLV
jgi:hypothetical protein